MAYLTVKVFNYQMVRDNEWVSEEGWTAWVQYKVIYH